MDIKESIVTILHDEGSCVHVQCAACVFKTKNSCSIQANSIKTGYTDHNAQRLQYVKMVISKYPEDYMEYLL